MNPAVTDVENFRSWLKTLQLSVAAPIKEPRDLSGIIKDFEMAYELSWKCLKKKLLSEGHETLGAKDVYSKAYKLNYIKDEAVWLDMIRDRNLTSHVYSEKDAKDIVPRVQKTYFQGLSSIGKIL